MEPGVNHFGSMRTLQHSQSHPAPNRPKTLNSRLSSTPSPARVSSTPSPARTLNTASTCSSGSSLPPSALRRGKYCTTSSHDCGQPAGPPIDLSIIHDAFGNASLYSVLNVKSSADNIAIRKAYLRQGRKTLLDHGIARKGDNGKCKFVTPEAAPKKLEDVPEDARKKFQAISIAYEILSTPELRHAYDAKELADKQTTVDIKRVMSGNSVRWNPFVEEKIIEDSHPDEHSHRIRGADGWLKMHLQRLDREAEMFLNGDFLDEIDESIASMSESLSESISSFMRKHGSTNSGVEIQSCANLSQAQGMQHQMIHGKTPQKSCLRGGKSLQVQTQFSNKMGAQGANPKGSPPLESPCSVAGVGEFVSEVVDEAASLLAESFSGLLDRPEAKLEDGNVRAFKPISIDEIRALERKRLDAQLREGFGEPFYSPPSPPRLGTRM